MLYLLQSEIWQYISRAFKRVDPMIYTFHETNVGKYMPKGVLITVGYYSKIFENMRYSEKSQIIIAEIRWAFIFLSCNQVMR